jgi:hypothetical protein
MKKLLLAILFLAGAIPASAYSDIEDGVRVFLTRDPAGFVDGPNLYTYVNQNPWTHFDPEGLATEQDYKNDEAKAQAWHDAAIKQAGGDKSKQKNVEDTYKSWTGADEKKITRIEESARLTNNAADLANKYYAETGTKGHINHVDANTLDDADPAMAGVFLLHDRAAETQNLANVVSGEIPIGEILGPALTKLFSVGTKATEEVAVESGGQLVSANVRAFMRGEKALSDLTPTERAQAIRGFEQAAQAAKTPADAAYQQARAAALRGEGPPPGSLSDWRKNFKQ